MDNAFGGETYFVLDDKNNESDKTKTSNTQQVVETKECKSPCLLVQKCA